MNEDGAVRNDQSGAKKVFIYFVLAFLVVGLIGGTFFWHGAKVYYINKLFSKPTIPVMTISAEKAKKQSLSHYLSAVGTVIANKGVTVTPRVAGMVTGVSFRSGDHVKSGQVLVQLDDAIDQRVLAYDLIQLKLDQLAFERNLKVAQKTQSVSKKDLDNARGVYEQQKNKVQQDRLNIAYKKIRAPFSGKLGLRQVNIGQFVQAGASLVTLQDLKKVNVDFNLPQNQLSLIKVGQKVTLSTTAFPGQAFMGTVQAVSPKLDLETRTIKVRASFDNKKMLLLPGQFVSLRVMLPARIGVVTVPMTALSYTLYGDSVYRIKASKVSGKSVLTATTVPVKVGVRRGNVVEIKKGINAGDLVVISGQIKLYNGSHVKINNLK